MINNILSPGLWYEKKKKKMAMNAGMHVLFPAAFIV